MQLHARQGNGERRAAARPRRVWAVLLGFALLGCSDSPDTVGLEVYTWWELESERQAFAAVIDIHQRRHENVEVENIGNDEAPDVRQRMAARVLAGAPPATFQANIGADVLRWTMVETQDDPEDVQMDQDVIRSRWIHDLSDFYLRTKLRTELEDKLRDGLIDGLVVRGTTAPFAVPINVHRINVLYYNVTELETVEDQLAERGQPVSLLDIETLCTTDFEGTDLQIAVGVEQPFSLVLLTFESILPGLFGAEFYERVFSGERFRSDPNPSEEVREALACVQHLSRWFLREAGWAVAVDRVRTEDATFTVMGDWANGLLDDPEETIVRGVPFPAREGVGGTFVYTSDTFPLPLDAKHPKEAEALLETIASKEAQLAFSRHKGSIPAREDVNIDSLPASRQRTVDDYNRLPRVLATSGFFPTYYWQELLSGALVRMTADGADAADLEYALQVFTDAEPLLGRWQERMEFGAAEPYEPGPVP